MKINNNNVKTIEENKAMEYICKTDIKRKYGFTESLIDKFLPEAELTKRNPKYKCAAPMQLWLITTVERAMETEEFKAAMEKTKKRKASAQKVAEAKRAETYRIIEEEIKNLTVYKLSYEKAESEALKSQVNFYRWKGYLHPEDAYGADEATITRWTVNFIRHELTNYGAVVDSLSRRVGKSGAYWDFDKAIYAKIAETYPKYSEECKRQYDAKFKREMRKEMYREMYA